MKRGLIRSILPYAIAAALLAFVIVRYWHADDGHGLHYVWNRYVVEGQPVPHPEYWFLANLVWLASLLLTFYRWRGLVRAADLPFTMIDAVRLGLVGNFFNCFMPGSVGGDVIKAAFIAREQDRRTRAIATVIMDRFLGLWALVWFVALLGGYFWLAGMLEGGAERVLKSIVQIAIVICGVSLPVWVGFGMLPETRAGKFSERLSRIPKAGHTLNELWSAFWLYHRRPGAVLWAMIVSLVGFVGFTLTYYYSALTFQEADQPLPSWQEHFLIVPIGMVIQAFIVFSPGGTGAGELGFGGLYKLINYNSEDGVLMSLTWRIISWFTGLVGYLIYLRMKPKFQEEKANEQ